VVVGGGFGGASAARQLRLSANVEVTLIEREAAFVSCPLSNLVVAGYRSLGDLMRGYERLTAIGVKLLRGEVVAIDVAAKALRLGDGSALRYDRLVLSPGVDFMADEVPGLGAALGSGRVVHAWKAGPQTLALRRQLEAMPDGGVVAISIPKMPYRCPPAAYERACLVASHLRAAKPRSKLLLLDANPEIQSKKALFERAFAEQYAGLLEYRPDAELREVAGGLARFDFEDVKADVLNVIPPQRAADLARAAGLANINQRWVGVDWLTMESTAAPGIHVLGDAVFPAPLMPKAGQMANQHARIAAAAIVQSLKGERPPPPPELTSTCYSFVTPTEAVHLASVHRYDVVEKAFHAVPGAGGLSAQASVQEGREAWAWAERVWHDMLG
jgi:sulfite dehydrogenase